MSRSQTLLVAGLTAIVLITLVAVLWKPASQAFSLIFFNGAKSEATGIQTDQSVVKLLKPAGGESFELFETIEFEWCWYKTLRSTSDKFVIYLTAAHHEQVSTASPVPIDENCYRFETTGYDIASLPGEYELQMKIQKEPSNLILGLSDSRKVILLLDGSLITPTPTNTSTPTATATDRPTMTFTPSQTPTVQPTSTPNFRQTWTPTSTPILAPTVTPSPTQIPPLPTNTQPPPPPPPKPTSVPPPATSTPPLPPPPPATKPPPKATPTPP